ncbi:MAG: 50S ribosomal protein L10 [Pirellulales bacterium]|nr:50S ribosomal protein L10 [Pirellulales bacterium]
MSKYVKNLISDHLRERLKDVNDALLVNVIGLKSNATMRLRNELASKNIQLLVVKNSMAARATEGTSLAPMFEGLTGTSAICWGCEDIVSLAKEITKLVRDEKNKPFEARGGVMDGERLSPEKVGQVAKWPGRAEQLAMLVGQILSPGADLVSQLTSMGGALASQIEQQGEGAEEALAEEATPEAAPAAG